MSSRAIPGYKGGVYSTGDPVGFTEEPATLQGNVARIADEALSIFNWKESIQVFDDGVLVDPADYSVDYLAGVVEFDTAPSGPITISGEYLPRLELAGIVEANFETSSEEIDSTCFSDLYEQYVSGLGQVTGSFTSIAIATAETLADKFLEENSLVIEHEIAEGSFRLRAVIQVETTVEQSVEDRVEVSVDYTGQNPAGLNGGQAHFTFIKE